MVKVNIIPKAKSIKELIGALAVNELRSFYVAPELERIVPTVQRILKPYFLEPPLLNGKGTGIRFLFDKKLAKEEYRLVVRQVGVEISAATHAGAIFGLQTFRQIARLDDKGADNIVVAMEIVDSPKYLWRGVMLDEARHFFGKQTVKRLLDAMSLFKLNVFHWHLTDDQGWRIEIKKYPRLTEVGATREKTQIGGWQQTGDDNTPHSGHYTQADIKEIVAYADELGIMVVPEIDMPAHFTAAFAAYPNLACREVETKPHWFFGGKYPTSIGWKDWNRSACIGKPETMQFIRDVIDEISELFPAPYFHIGGDEAPKGEWKKCPHCKKLRKEHKIRGVKKQQQYFIHEVNRYVKSKGKHLIGWNEVLEGGALDNSILVQYWVRQKDKNVAKHIANSGKVVMSKHQSFYFDYSHAYCSLKDTYNFQPFIDGINPAHHRMIQGVEAPLWTEWVATQDKVDMQLFPRVLAVAEVGWAQSRENYSEFESRVFDAEKLLAGLGIHYAEREIYANKDEKEKEKIRDLWLKSDQDYELRKNQELKSKK